jgi:hypothetical protein
LECHGTLHTVSQEIIWVGLRHDGELFRGIKDKNTHQGWVLTLRDMTPLRDFDRLKTEIMNA